MPCAAHQVTVRQRLQCDATVAGEEVFVGGQERCLARLQIVDADAAAAQAIAGEPGHQHVLAIGVGQRGAGTADVSLPFRARCRMVRALHNEAVSLLLAKLN